MYKKIAAGILAVALTFGSTAVPNGMFIGTNGSTVLHASADDSIDGFSYTLLSDGTAEITGYSGNDSEVTVPETIGGKKVTSIGESAFISNSGITSISLPSTLKNIGEKAFLYCKNAETIDIPDSVSSIGAKAFAHCKKLKKAVVPNGVKTINQDVFNWCEGLESVTLPDGITSIGDGAFTSCTSLTSLEIPNGVVSIGASAFAYCRNLAELSIPDSVTYAGAKAFYNNAWYNNLPDGLFYAGKTAYAYIGTMPENSSVTLKSGTTYIADGAFKNCSVSSISIPSSVTGIGKQAFYKTSLKNVTIPDSVTEIGSEAFASCENLSEINIPSSINSIGSKAFSWCTSLKSAVIPNGVKTIENSTFANCKALVSVTIPDSVTSLESSAFDGCISLTSVNVPSFVNEIGFAAFRYCPITNLDIPDGVTKIEPNTFYGCANLTTISIPKGVTSIGYSAFYNCVNMKSLAIPSSVTSIGKEAVGYYYDTSAGAKKTITEFLITGTQGSAAETYANENNIKFLNSSTDPVKTDISKCTVTLSDTNFEYTGSEIKPTVTVKDGSKTLTNGTDYTVSYSNNIKEGTASVIISGIGNYKGSVSQNFTIVKKDEPVVTDISNCTITLSETSFSYTGSAVKPKVTIKNGSNTLVINTDYVMRYVNNIEPGTASIVISGKGNYTGSVTKTFTIESPVTNDISNFTITLSGTSFSYTGSAIKPKVTVKNGSKTLVLGTDYAVRYIDNIEIGTASVKIAGKGDYTGSVTKTFTITDAAVKSISDCTITLSKGVFNSTGNAIKPKVTVTDGGKTLVSGTDYVIRYVNNINPGTASVVIAGRGNYTGSVTKTFTILNSNAADISACNITLSKTSFAYTGSGIKPRVTVSYNGKTLTAGTDYVVKYVNNVNPGTAQVVVSGKGDYKGTVTINFTITN